MVESVGSREIAISFCKRALENDFLEGPLGQSRFSERKAMIEPAHDLTITKQAKALNISRGSVYYLPRPVPGNLRSAIHVGSPPGLCGYGMSVARHHPLNSMIYRPPL
jgi:hypothetical protein